MDGPFKNNSVFALLCVFMVALSGKADACRRTLQTVQPQQNLTETMQTLNTTGEMSPELHDAIASLISMGAGAAIGAASGCPPCGKVAGAVVGFIVKKLWPKNEPSLWDQVADQVKTYVDSALVQAKTDSLEANINALQRTLVKYQDATMGADKGGWLQNAITAADQIFAQLEINNPKSPPRYNYLPLAAVVAPVHLLAMRDMYLFGEQLFNKTRDPSWESALLEQYNDYINYFDAVFREYRVWRADQDTCKVYRHPRDWVATAIMKDAKLDKTLTNQCFHDCIEHNSDSFDQLCVTQKGFLSSVWGHAEMAKVLSPMTKLHYLLPDPAQPPRRWNLDLTLGPFNAWSDAETKREEPPYGPVGLRYPTRRGSGVISGVNMWAYGNDPAVRALQFLYGDDKLPSDLLGCDTAGRPIKNPPPGCFNSKTEPPTYKLELEAGTYLNGLVMLVDRQKTFQIVSVRFSIANVTNDSQSWWSPGYGATSQATSGYRAVMSGMQLTGMETYLGYKDWMASSRAYSGPVGIAELSPNFKPAPDVPLSTLPTAVQARPTPPSPTLSPEIDNTCPPDQQTCIILGDSVIDTSCKSCTSCQFQCLTHPQCVSMGFGGDLFPKNELPLTPCEPPPPFNGCDTYALCTILGEDNEHKNNQYMRCCDCIEQCLTWGECDSVIFNTVTYPREGLSKAVCDGSNRRLL